MNIDVLFINNKLENFEEYFDENQFKEYCDTHSFNGKLNQILSVPPSYSKNENKTFLIGIGDDDTIVNFYDIGISIGLKIESDSVINFLNLDQDKTLIIDGILYSQYKFNSYKSEENSTINSVSFKGVDTFENELKQSSIFWVRNLINTPALDKSPEVFIDKVKELVNSSEIEV